MRKADAQLCGTNAVVPISAVPGLTWKQRLRGGFYCPPLSPSAVCSSASVRMLLHSVPGTVALGMRDGLLAIKAPTISKPFPVPRAHGKGEICDCMRCFVYNTNPTGKRICLIDNNRRNCCSQYEVLHRTMPLLRPVMVVVQPPFPLPPWVLGSRIAWNCPCRRYCLLCANPTLP